MVRPAAVRRLLRSERERLDSRVHQLADRADRERAREEQVLDDFCGRLRVRADRRLRAEGDRLDSLARAVRSSDPKQVLRRGFAIVRDGDGGVLRAAERAASERELRIQFHEGVLRLPVSEDSEVSEE
jgi:exodeoxyribonuclease VII large subunit